MAGRILIYIQFQGERIRSLLAMENVQDESIQGLHLKDQGPKHGHVLSKATQNQVQNQLWASTPGFFLLHYSRYAFMYLSPYVQLYERIVLSQLTYIVLYMFFQFYLRYLEKLSTAAIPLLKSKINLVKKVGNIILTLGDICLQVCCLLVGQHWVY